MGNTKTTLTKKDYQRVAEALRNAVLAHIELDEASGVQAPDSLRERIFAQIAVFPRRARRARRLRNIAVASLVILFTSGIIFTSNAAAHEALLKWFAEHADNRFVFFFTGKMRTTPLKEYVITADIPDRFQLVESDKDDEWSAVWYLTEDRLEMIAFEYSYMHDGTSISIQSTKGNNLAVEAVSVNGLPGEFYRDGDDANGNVLVWIDEKEEIAFSITSTLSKEEILILAESVCQP